MAGKRLKAVERKEEIIKAAISTVAKHNFDRATISKIAKEARINEALIYQHFDNKKALMLALLDYINGFINEAMNSGGAQDDPSLASLRRAGVSYYESARLNIDMLKCVQAATTAGDVEIRNKALQHIKSFQGFIKDRIDIAAKNGLVDETFDTDIMAWGILGVQWMVSLMLMLDHPELMPMKRLDKVYWKLEELLKIDRERRSGSRAKK